MAKMLYAYADVGRTGLCNMLFPWARAVLFARKRNCKMLAPQWTNIMRIGPWVRMERDKRYYSNIFTNAGYIGGLRKYYILATTLAKRYDEEYPRLCDVNSGVVVFKGWKNYFDVLEEEAPFIKEELYRIVAPNIVLRLEALPASYIGVHVRLGDFVSTGQSMPLDYYVRGIEAALELAGESLPVLVFSDAKADELAALSKLSGVVIMPPAPAIHDVLALSRSSVLVGTNHSTFSEWAVFLGGMKSIWSKNGRKPNVSSNITFV